jgi:hypothetical protein
MSALLLHTSAASEQGAATAAATGSYERRRIGAPTRALLCAFAAVDLSRPLPVGGVDWDEAFEAACDHGLVGIVQHYLQARPQHGCPPAFCARIQAAYRRARLRMALNEQAAAQLFAQLEQAEVEYIVLKGPALAQLIYPAPAMRLYGDLDILVRERDWGRTHTALTTLGYRQEEDWPAPPPKLVPQWCYYETKYWHERTQFLVEVHYDDLLNAGLASRSAEAFWRRATWIALPGLGTLRALALDDQVLTLCAHAHFHGYTRLSWLSDLALLVRDHGARIDWQRLIETARAEEAQVGVYYSLLVLRELLGVAAPSSVFDALRPDAFRRWVHEQYLPMGQVLGLQPMWRPDLSFYHTPLYKRMLPDLLVMGRRAEKLCYLARLLLPPPDWLRHYYHLDEAAALAPHYLLHPLKLLCHYAAETAGALWPWRRADEEHDDEE